MAGYHRGGGAVYWNHPYSTHIGCKKVSEACAHCYAEAVCKRFDMNKDGTFEPKKVENARKMPKKGVVFVDNMTDFMGEWLTDEEVCGIVEKCRSGIEHDRVSLFLTKRAKRYDSVHVFQQRLDKELGYCNSYFGVTAENQERWNERKASLCRLRERGFKTWVSVEPLLGYVDLCLTNLSKAYCPNFVVVGAESGSERRPCDIEWVREVVKECKYCGVPVFVKQLDINGRLVTDINEFPEDLRIRERPWGNKYDKPKKDMEEQK